jgi:spermidine/putrescine transport system ATP-binding protein
VHSVDDDLAVLAYGPDDRVMVPCPRVTAPGDAVEVSIRPEKIGLHRAPPRGARLSVLSGVVTEVVYHGTSTNYTVSTAAGPDLVVFDQNASDAEDLAGRGDRVFLSWSPQHSYPIGA